MSVSFKDRTWEADYKLPEQVSLVGCLKRKSEGAAVKQCELEDSDKKKISLPLIPVVYEMSVYEAKTGKKLGTKEISGPAKSCPFFAAYSKENPKLYADADPGAVEAGVAEFVTK